MFISRNRASGSSNNGLRKGGALPKIASSISRPRSQSNSVSSSTARGGALSTGTARVSVTQAAAGGGGVGGSSNIAMKRQRRTSGVANTTA